MDRIRQYSGLSQPQMQLFRMLFDSFSQKDRTVLKEGVGSIILTFANQADLLIWDELVKKEGL